MQLTNDSLRTNETSAADIAFLSQLLSAAGESIIATDLDGVVQYWNRAAEQTYGYSAEEALGRPIHELTVPEIAAEEGQRIMERVTAGATWEGEFVVRTRDGRHFPAHVVDSPTIDDRGSIIGVVGVSRDITERKQAREALEQSEQRWRSLAQATPALICETDAHGRVTYCNDRFERYSGLRVDDLHRDGWSAVAHEDDVDRLRHLRSRATRRAEAFAAEVRLRSADGQYRWHLAFAEPRGHRNGRPDGWIWASVDVHDQRLTEDRLRAANAAKDEFLGLVSHEVKTPITMILGNAELLSRRRNMLSDEDVETALGDIHGEANELTAIIENMLVLARLDDDGEIETEPLRLERAAGDAIARHQRRHPSRSIRLTVPDAPPLVEASPVYVQQILGNLISNAEKYSSATSAIEVEVRASDDVVEARVADRGPGVDVDEIERIFRPFYRSANARTAPGMGIGLAVCRRLAEAQGGTIGMDPRPGGGLIATLSLPQGEE